MPPVRWRVIIPISMELLPAEGIVSAAPESCESGTDATKAMRRNARVALVVSVTPFSVTGFPTTRSSAALLSRTAGSVCRPRDARPSARSYSSASSSIRTFSIALMTVLT